MCSARPASSTAGDARRLEALRATGLLGAPEVPSLTRLADLAATLLEAPAALVALADTEEQVVLGAAGPAVRPGTRRTPLRDSLCGRVVARDAPLVVPDVRGDARTGGRWRGDPAVPGLEAGSCAGFPLRAPDGGVLGGAGGDRRPGPGGGGRRSWTRPRTSRRWPRRRSGRGSPRARRCWRNAGRARSSTGPMTRSSPWTPKEP
ncbi:GAF domain-containing protein [Planomonospora algeriensis]